MQDRYRIARELGGGGMGQVYLAHDLRLADKPCAVKELVPDLSTPPEERELTAAQFHREAAMLAHLDHPNLPNVYDYFEERESFYLVMDFVEGETLAESLEQSPDGLPAERVVDIGLQLCDVLDYLHRQSPPIIFRDVKPANVMVTAEGDIKLIDFGIVRLFDPAKRTDTLKMGTTGYAPPEQYAGQGQTTPRSDLYSLGVTLHELLTGEDPTAHPFLFDPPRQLSPGVSPALSKAVMCAVSMDPSDRFPSAGAMKEALQKATQPRRFHLPLIERQRGSETKVLPETSAAPAERSRPVRIALDVGRWLGRIAVPVVLGGLVALVILLIAAAFVVSLIARSAVASADWGLSSVERGEYIMPEDEVSEGLWEVVNVYAPDAFLDARVDFRSPDGVIVFFYTDSRDYSIEARVGERDGAPTIVLERFNQLPLYGVGGIISGGINRGFEQVWDDVSLEIESIEINSTEIRLDLVR